MGLIETFEKQGGMELLKSYRKGGALFTAGAEFVLLGRSRIALELLRLSAQLKIRQKLEKRYRRVLTSFDRTWKDDILHRDSKKVWICWFQGLENAPELVQRCVASVRENMPNREVIVITADNMEKYTRFPAYILEKWKNGQITHTHMTDLLRLELLIRHGGLWLDATVLCSGGNIPDYMIYSDLFFFQCLKPGRNGHSNYISSWLMCAKTNQKVLMAVRALLYAYWKENEEMWDYFLLHDFMSIVLEHYPEEWMKIIPRDNAAPHILLLRLFEKYDERTWQAVRTQTPFHKLTYKFDPEEKKKEGTYYKVLIDQQGIQN